jgi:hypothetical protein
MMMYGNMKETRKCNMNKIMTRTAHKVGQGTFITEKMDNCFSVVYDCSTLSGLNMKYWQIFKRAEEL